MSRLLLFFFMLSILPAHAQDRQREYKGGLNHTYIRKYEPAAGTPDTAPDTKEETPVSRVWTKYRALAAGQEEGEETTAAPEAPTAPEKPALQQQQQAAPPPTGIAAIIADYRKNRERKSQVRHLQITKPDAPASPEPAAPPENPPPTP